MDVRPIAPALGAEIIGIDVKTLDAEGFAAVERVFHDRSVIVMRDQDLTPDDHIAFAQLPQHSLELWAPFRGA